MQLVKKFLFLSLNEQMQLSQAEVFKEHPTDISSSDDNSLHPQLTFS